MNQIINWYNNNLESLQFNRLGVMGAMLMFQTCIIIPVTILVTSTSAMFPVAIGITTVLSFSLLTICIAGLNIRIALALFALNILAHAGLILIA